MQDDYTPGMSLSELLRTEEVNLGRGDQNLGAVIVFRPSIASAVEAQQVLDELHRRGIIERTYVHEYDPRMGGPVWYIP
jgi:hypothetical protein